MKHRLVALLKKYKFTFILGKTVKIIFYNYILDSIQYIRYLLVKNGIIKNTKYEAIKAFKDKHLGDRCFIVATGSSLTYEDLDLIKNDHSFSVNSIVKVMDNTLWRPTYYGIQDANVYAKIENDVLKSKFEYVFVGNKVQKKFKSATQYIPFFHFSCFHGKHGEMLPLTSGFSEDVSEIVYDGYSVTYSMLQLAVYMGFKEIYLLGCDCSYDVTGKQHFVESGFFDKQAATVGERMIYAYGYAKKYADKNDLKIYNATRGGMLEVFERIDLQTLFKNN